jgi:hypothetical protein
LTAWKRWPAPYIRRRSNDDRYSTCERRSVAAALPPHIAESLRLSDVLFFRTCGEAQPRRISKIESPMVRQSLTAMLLRQSRIKLDSQTLQENAQDEIKS